MIVNQDIDATLVGGSPASEGRFPAQGAHPSEIPEDLLGGPAALLDLSPGAWASLRGSLHASGDVADLMAELGRPGVMDALDAALDLTPGDRGSLLGTLSRMTREDAEGALKALAELLKRGIVGYEYRKVNGEPMKVFIDVAIGSDMARAPLVRGGRFDRWV